MSVFQTGHGGLIFQATALTNTSQTVVADGTSKAGMIINTVQISNTTASPINVQVHISDGTTDWQLEGGISVGANDQEIIPHPGFPLTSNYSLKATGDTGIQVLVTYIRHTYAREGAAPVSQLNRSGM